MAPLAANVRGQGLQGEERIFGDEKGHGQRCVRQRGNARAGDYGGNGATGEGGSDIVVAIEPLAAHGKEQVVGTCGTRVDGVARDNQRTRVGKRRRRFKHCARADCRLCKGKFHFPSR